MNRYFRHFLLSFLTIFSLTGHLCAQHLEVGLLGGASNYLGDLSSNSETVYLTESNLAGGVFMRYNFSHIGAIRLGFNYGNVSGHDQNAKQLDQQQRNLSFTSPIMEVAVIGEYNILGYQPYNLARPFSPYLFAGFGLFNFNPSTIYQGEEVKLQPLGTEGQGSEGRPALYQRTAFTIPMGLGVKYAINDKWNIGLELGARMTATDYLDDVSTIYIDAVALNRTNGPLAAALNNRTGELSGGEPINFPTGTPRGDDNAKDWYFIAGLTISYNFLDNGLVGSRSRLRRGKKGCETN